MPFQRPNLHILIVEDDLLIAEMLKEMLLELEYDVVGIANTFERALIFLKGNTSINLCFLDINLEADKNGFDVAGELRNTYHIPFVFLSSYSDRKTVSEAALFKPEAYLLKPFSQTDLFATLAIISAKQQLDEGAQKQHIIIKDGSVNVKLDIHDIRWLKSDNIYVEVRTKDKTHVIRNSLERFMDELQQGMFLRIHRSYAVNMKHVQAVNGQYLVVDGEKVPLSRKFKDEVFEHFRGT